MGSTSRRPPPSGTTLVGISLACCLLLAIPLHLRLPDVPLWVLTVYDIMLAGLGVLMRAFSTAKTGALPFWHACSRLKQGNVRGFLSWLHLVQAIHLHVCARLEASTALRMLSALLTTLPWWMDRRGGWTIVMKGSSTFSEIVDAEPKNGSTLSLLLSHVLHLHGLFHGLNITCALSHFAGAPEHGVVELAHFRLYWLSLVATSAADVMLQPLVDRKMLPPRALPYLLGASVLPAVVLALPVLSEHVSFISTAASFALWWGREHRALSNLALALAFSQLYEIVALLAARYSLVDA